MPLSASGKWFQVEAPDLLRKPSAPPLPYQNSVSPLFSTIWPPVPVVTPGVLLDMQFPPPLPILPTRIKESYGQQAVVPIITASPMPSFVVGQQDPLKPRPPMNWETGDRDPLLTPNYFIIPSMNTWYQQASRPLPRIPTLPVLGGGEETFTPDVDMRQLYLRWQPQAPHVRPQPLPVPQGQSQLPPLATVSITIDLWYQQASEPKPLTWKVHQQQYAQPLEGVQLDQTLTWLVQQPRPLPPPPRQVQEGAAEVLLPDSARVNFSWYVAPDRPPQPIPPLRIGPQDYGWFPVGAVVAAPPYFVTAADVYVAGAVAFDSESS